MSHGKFCWYDYFSTDVKKSTAFYEELLGWKISDTPNMPGYNMINVDPTSKDFTGIGGMMDAAKTIGPNKPSHWAPYITVNGKLEDWAAAAVDQGAKLLHGPKDVPNRGRWSLMQDPAGADFYLWENSVTTKPEPDKKDKGHSWPIAWHQVYSDKGKALYEFYGRFFGWKYSGDDQHPSSKDGVWSRDDEPIYAGYHQYPFQHIDANQKPAWILYFKVKDVYATVAKAKALGAKVHKPIETISVWGSFAVLGDTTGATFAVFQDKDTPLNVNATYTAPPKPVVAAAAAAGAVGAIKPNAAIVGAAFDEKKKAAAASSVKRETHGVFCWADYNTPNADGAKAFYSKLLGWKLIDSSMPGFTMVGTDAKDMKSSFGGIQSTPNEKSSEWLPFINVDGAVETSAAKIVKAGGAQIGKVEVVPNRGRYVVVKDFSGARFALWQNTDANPPASKPEDEDKNIAWRQLFTTDSAKAGPFYAGVFDWKTEKVGASDLWSTASRPMYAGQMQIPKGAAQQPAWVLYFTTADCDATVKAAVAAGAKVAKEAETSPGIGRFAVLVDPFGATFAVYQPEAKSGAATAAAGATEAAESKKPKRKTSSIGKKAAEENGNGAAAAAAATSTATATAADGTDETEKPTPSKRVRREPSSRGLTRGNSVVKYTQ